MHNNVYSLLPKLDLIEHEFRDYDVICISESHLDKSIDNDKIKLKGFQNPVRLARNRHGGGVNIYVKKILYYKVRTDLSVNNLEIFWVEIRISNNDKCLIHRSIQQVPISVVKFVASNTTFSKFNRFNIFFK
jgi:exonuclease III